MDYRKVLTADRAPTTDYSPGDDAIDGYLENLPPSLSDKEVIEALATKLGQVLVDLLHRQQDEQPFAIVACGCPCHKLPCLVCDHVAKRTR